MSNYDENQQEPTEATALNWGPDAPRGGKAVANRIIKEDAAVPLFFGQTLIQSLRDVGYNHTTSALCEHVDNSIQAGAKEVRVYIRQTGKKGNYRIDTAVYDNGFGMDKSVLKVATSFGGSMTFGNRKGIGRFGLGMKTAALSMSSVMELYSWQEPGAIYNMTLDVDAIGKDKRNAIELSSPSLYTELPHEVADLFKKPLDYPKDRADQELLAGGDAELSERLGKSGTIVYMPECDRLTHAKASTLVDHAVKEMAHVYRRAIGRGLKLFINNRRIEAWDPTYSMPNARHTRVEGTRASRRPGADAPPPAAVPPGSRFGRAVNAQSGRRSPMGYGGAAPREGARDRRWRAERPCALTAIPEHRRARPGRTLASRQTPARVANCS